jgi:hypothetical protein
MGESAVRSSLARAGRHATVRPMREILILAIHLLVTFAKLVRPGGNGSNTAAERLATWRKGQGPLLAAGCLFADSLSVGERGCIHGSPLYQRCAFP